MDTSRKICTVLTEQDLSAGNIKSTVKWIENNPNKFYLLETGNLWEVVETLSKSGSDDNLVTRMRIAYNLKFDLQTVLKAGDDLSVQGNEVKNFADLLELLDFDENLNLARADYHVIINDDNHLNENAEPANRAVVKLFQQAIFLSIVGLDIQKKSEIYKAQVTERFCKNYPTLLKQINENQADIERILKDNKSLSAESIERADKIISSFEVILSEFEKAKERNIRIAAMGTKKAGKSVVINSLLKCDCAPTSLTMPTPNTIKYIPGDKNGNIILDYADPKTIRYVSDDKGDRKLEYNPKTYSFKTEDEISDFINDEFERAMKITGEGAGLPDMMIHYPPGEGLTGYDVWDTPGPNVAFTDEHRKNAEECIKGEGADVCIFVMNYSNHLTNDEVNFLNDIHSFFQENNKFYSLFIALNRIDERYNDREAKNINRVLDYISNRLEDMGYKNIVVFGTSALQSFYLDHVVELAKEEDLPVVNDSIRPLKKIYTDSKSKASLVFIGKAFFNLESFHDIEEGTEKELYALSGMPQLQAYTNYIGGAKANMERINSVVTHCEAKFVIVNNSLLVNKLFELSDKDKQSLEELSRLIEGLSRDVGRAIDAVRPLMNDDKKDAAAYRISQEVRSIKKQAANDADRRGRDIFNQLRLTEEDVKYMSTHCGEKSRKVLEMENQIAQMVHGINRRSIVNLDTAKNLISEGQIQIVEQGIQGAQEIISRKTDEVKNKVENTTAKNILANFKKPEFPPAIDRLTVELEKISVGMDDDTLTRAASDSHRETQEVKTKTEYREKTRTVYDKVKRTGTREKRNKSLWESFRSFFGKTYYETYEYDDIVEREEKFKEPYEVSYTVKHDVYDVERFKAEIARELQSRITAAIDDAHDKMESAIKIEIKNIFDNVKQQCEEISDSYKQIYDDFAKDINMAKDSTDKHRAALLRDIGTFNEIKAKLQPFFNTWNTILHAKE